MTDGGLKHLKGLTKLQSLDLSHTEVTDAGLEHLRGLTGLQSLNLMWCIKLTDLGLEHLKALRKLQTLVLSNTNVTDAGVKKLRQALPNCKIETVTIGFGDSRQPRHCWSLRSGRGGTRAVGCAGSICTWRLG